MDAFVNKVRDVDAAPPLRVVSQRSMRSVELARLRAALRQLWRQRDEGLRLLGRTCLEALDGPSPDLTANEALSARARAVSAVEREIAAFEQRIERLQLAESTASRPSTFLTVCPCGSPLLPEDSACVACGRDVEALVRLAAESKSQQTSIPCACGAPLVAGVRFCPQCGEGVVDLLAGAGLPVHDDVPRCPGCGDAASPGDSFCSGCGRGIA